MKQLTKRILSLALALMMFASVAGTASALAHEAAGIYTWVSGTCEQNEANAIILDTTTFVKVNPDHAYLVTKVKYSDGINHTDEEQASSTTGVITFAYSFPIRVTIDLTPNKVYRTHEVRGGTESDRGYAYYTDSDIEVP